MDPFATSRLAWLAVLSHKTQHGSCRRAAIGGVLTLAVFGFAAAPAADAASPLRVFTMLRAEGELGGLADVAPAAEGGFFVLNGGTVHRIDRLGRLVRVAGSLRRNGYSGDGGPAREATFNQAADVAVTDDGGLLIADTWNCAVRRVDPNGTVTTVAGPGTVPCGTSAPVPGSDIGDGGPAVSVKGSLFPTGVSPVPGGGFLVVDSTNQRVRRVDGVGIIRTVAGTGTQGDAPTGYGKPATSVSIRNPTNVAATADGGFVFADASGAHRVASDGTLSGVLAALPGTDTSWLGLASQVGLTESGVPYRFGPKPGQIRVLGQGPMDLRLSERSGFFDGNGDPLNRATLLGIGGGLREVEPTDEGGLLLNRSNRVDVAAPPTTRTLGVAVARESLRALAHRRLRVRSTLPARVRVRLNGKGKRVVEIAAKTSAGLTMLRLPRTLPGGVYWVRVRATTAEGAVATDRLRVLGRNAPPLVDRPFGCRTGLFRPLQRI